MSAIESYKEDWVTSLQNTAGRFRLIFVQLGAAHRPIRESIETSLPTVLTVSDYLTSPVRSIAGKLILLSDLDSVRESGPDSNSLNVLRERVVTDMDAGFDFIMLSRTPRISYPTVPGSSLLEDARFFRGPLFPQAPSVPGRYADPAHVLPESAENGTALDQILLDILRELGVEVCASLDHAMFEAMLDPADIFTHLSPREIEGLEGGGLATTTDRQVRWTMPRRLGELKEALSDVLASQTTPQPSVTDVFDSLWALERSIRQSIRSQALRVWGQEWKQKVLKGDLPAKVLERARVSAYAAAKSINEIRDPLEWLSLGELLETRVSNQDLGDLGVENPIWKIFGNEVLPIRNRLSHMRLMRPDDLPTVKRWVKVMERKLRR